METVLNYFLLFLALVGLPLAWLYAKKHNQLGRDIDEKRPIFGSKKEIRGRHARNFKRDMTLGFAVCIVLYLFLR